MTKPKDQSPALSFKLSNELREYLRSQAEAGFRSISKEIVMRLEASRQADQQSITPKETP